MMMTNQSDGLVIQSNLKLGASYSSGSNFIFKFTVPPSNDDDNDDNNNNNDDDR